MVYDKNCYDSPGSFYEIRNQIKAYRITTHNWISVVDFFKSGGFLLLKNNCPVADFSSDFSDLMEAYCKNNPDATYDYFNRYIFNNKTSEKIDSVSLFTPITWCEKIIYKDKIFFIPRENFKYYVRQKLIQITEID